MIINGDINQSVQHSNIRSHHGQFQNIRQSSLLRLPTAGYISGYLSVYLLWMSIVHQVLVIHQDNHFVRQSHKEVSVVLQTPDHCQELAIPNTIVSFGRVKGL